MGSFCRRTYCCNMSIQRKYLGLVNDTLHLLSDAGKKPGDIVTSKDIADYHGDDVKIAFANHNNTPIAINGIHKKIGDCLGPSGLQLRKKGNGYEMPITLPITDGDTLVHGAIYRR